MLARLTFIAALSLATASVAQVPPAAAPATAQEIAAAKAEADEIIKRAGADAYFDNATTTSTPQARHRSSGMMCSFTRADPRNEIALYPFREGGPAQGEDVSCGTWWGTTYLTVFATRYPAQYSADQLFAAAARDIHVNWQNVVAREGVLPGASIAGQEAPLIAVFDAERQGRAATTVLVLRNIGEWSFKGRATGVRNDDNVVVAATLGFGAAIPGGWEELQGQ